MARIETKPFPTISKLEPTDDFVVRFTADGKMKSLDFKTLSVWQRFPKLQDLRYFKTAKLVGSAVRWEDGFMMDVEEFVELGSEDSGESAASASEKVSAKYSIRHS